MRIVGARAGTLETKVLERVGSRAWVRKLSQPTRAALVREDDCEGNETNTALTAHGSGILRIVYLLRKQSNCGYLGARRRIIIILAVNTNMFDRKL